MSTVQLNAEIQRNLDTIADDESMLKRVAQFLRKVVSEKMEDDTLLSKEELNAKILQAEQDYQEGRTYAMLPGESFSDFRKRIGK